MKREQTVHLRVFLKILEVHSFSSDSGWHWVWSSADGGIRLSRVQPSRPLTALPPQSRPQPPVQPGRIPPVLPQIYEVSPCWFSWPPVTCPSPDATSCRMPSRWLWLEVLVLWEGLQVLICLCYLALVPWPTSGQLSLPCLLSSAGRCG